MTALDLFHFLRPQFLLALPVIGLVWWYIRKRATSQAEASEILAPHLRAALTVGEVSTSRIWPVDSVALCAMALALAAAGPTWSKQPSPWFSETAPLVVALEVSDSMRANDLLPSRLDRARFKILDLIAARTGSRTAILAYAGSAHVVVPPSTDIDVIKPLLESLDPAIMPVSGIRPETALAPALALLGEEAAVGTVLFVNDGFGDADLAALREFAESAGGPGVAALVIGTDEGGVALMPDGTPVTSESGGRLDTRVDAAALRRVESETSIAVTRMTTNDEDLRSVLRGIESKLAQADDPDARWEDRGWLFLWPAALLSLLWFRRGWTMRW